jgi:hemerythrin-like domain-containing protein
MAKSKAKKPAARKSVKAPDAIALLKKDHATVSAMFEQYDKLGDKALAKKLKLARTICKELKVHTQIEEEIFYPATREALPKEDDLLDEAQVEHDGAKKLIAELDAMMPGDDLFDAKVTVLSEYIKHHVKEEHEEMFPKVRKTKLDLNEIGMRLAFRKAELSKQIPG